MKAIKPSFVFEKVISFISGIMKILFNIFYNFLVLPILYASLRFAGLFNKKIRTGIIGRKRVYEELILTAYFY